MTEQKIGSQLDELGLTVDMEDGDRVAEAVVTVTTQDDNGTTQHRPVHVPTPALRPVPYPVEQRIITVVEAAQEISDEQRQRLCAWLRANGIDPQSVYTGDAITVHSRALDGKEGAYRIRYTEYYLDAGGARCADVGADRPLTVQRCVVQSVSFGEDPTVALS
jgi:hypothetical protein